MQRPRLSLTLGPVLFNWPVAKWVDFYARIADEAAVDRVCIGEVVCSKRKPFVDDVTLEVVDRLERGGKEVIYSTLALPTSKREIREISDVIQAGYRIEANDIATVHMLNGRPHIIGPFINIYNEDALALHLKLGATRICLPPELPLDSIRLLAKGNNAVEVFAFGRPPLALSARCYSARARGMAKDACQFICENERDGMNVETLDGTPFLAVNGIQTMGYVVTAAMRHVETLRDAGVVSLRLSPQSCDMVRVAKVFRDLADGVTTPKEAGEAISVLHLPGPLSDGFLRGVPGHMLTEVD
ncbi:collagenase-like PrtC family protease [Rhizomicrobium palustre]|uniref:Ubiquinone biosynthesis protein UbiV n=1 Tax=Rhizomicrobium palustre TaxID=189966 RepID=A0A846N0Y5_9PROT|nr:U32 family peptidase [Rhizomicrobium palustre]NIK88902.1 collagenase-like PrtC family protease [Rhizomicrobium palustre]